MARLKQTHFVFQFFNQAVSAEDVIIQGVTHNVEKVVFLNKDLVHHAMEPAPSTI